MSRPFESRTLNAAHVGRLSGLEYMAASRNGSAAGQWMQHGLLSNGAELPVAARAFLAAVQTDIDRMHCEARLAAGTPCAADLDRHEQALRRQRVAIREAIHGGDLDP